MSPDPNTTKPWLPNDPERKRHFHKGTPGKTSDRWLEKPKLEPCWRGNFRRWNIDRASTYQSQLWCRYWNVFINPSGFSCTICLAAAKDTTPPDSNYFPGQPPV